MEFNAEKYELVRTRVSDFTTEDYYDPANKVEVTLKKGDKVGQGYIKIRTNLNMEAYNAAQKEANKANAATADTFIKDLLDNEGLPDNELTRAMVEQLAQGYGYTQREVWEHMYLMEELYRIAKNFFARAWR